MRTAHLSLTQRGDEAVASAIAATRSQPALSESLLWALSPRYDVAVQLSFGNPSSGALRRLLAEMQAQDRSDDIEKAVLNDRAVFIDGVFSQFYGGNPSLPQPHIQRSRDHVIRDCLSWLCVRSHVHADPSSQFRSPCD